MVYAGYCIVSIVFAAINRNSIRRPRYVYPLHPRSLISTKRYSHRHLRSSLFHSLHLDIAFDYSPLFNPFDSNQAIRKSNDVKKIMRKNNKTIHLLIIWPLASELSRHVQMVVNAWHSS